MSEIDLINECIKKINKSNLENTSLSKTSIRCLEDKLNIILPDDFKILNSIRRHDHIGYYQYLNLETENDSSVIKQTKDLRKIYKLSNEYVILLQDDTSAIFLKTTHENHCQVIYCDIMDAMNLLEGRLMEYSPTIYNSYAEFYKFLLDEEEKQLNEENK